MSFQFNLIKWSQKSCNDELVCISEMLWFYLFNVTRIRTLTDPVRALAVAFFTVEFRLLYWHIRELKLKVLTRTVLFTVNYRF